MYCHSNVFECLWLSKHFPRVSMFSRVGNMRSKFVYYLRACSSSYCASKSKSSSVKNSNPFKNEWIAYLSFSLNLWAKYWGYFSSTDPWRDSAWDFIVLVFVCLNWPIYPLWFAILSGCILFSEESLTLFFLGETLELFNWLTFYDWDVVWAGSPCLVELSIFFNFNFCDFVIYCIGLFKAIWSILC